ncbi:MAG: DNA polymerase IV [Syntrophobacteraceae bacterium]
MRSPHLVCFQDRSMVHRILHIDMDAFYASVEQADQPELAGKPVIIGGSKRGVAAAVSYEARKFGVRSAMPIFEARRLCPDGVFLPVRMTRYQEVSRQVMQILDTVSPMVEQASIDEAYVDVTGTESLHGPEIALITKIKDTIRDRTSLTCSIGIAPNRFLAKIASEMNKPDGWTIINQEDVAALLQKLPINKIPGIGQKTALVMKDLGIQTAMDVLKFSREFWVKRLGKGGADLYERAQGVGPTVVIPHRAPKSCSAEDTFASDTGDTEELKKWLLRQAEEVGRDLRKHGIKGKTITLKVKFSNFKTVTRSTTLPEETHSTRAIYDTAVKLLSALRLKEKVRLIGVGVSNFAVGMVQKSLFTNKSIQKQEELDLALDRIHDKFGRKAILRGRVGEIES